MATGILQICNHDILIILCHCCALAVMQLFELLLSIVGKPQYRALVGPARRDMVYVAVGYMQMIQDQVGYSAGLHV